MSKQEHKHTPGPWHLKSSLWESKEGHTHYCADITPSDDGPWYRGPVTSVQSCDHLERGIGRKEAEANARLIVAAPELLEALEAICEMQDRRYGDGTSTHMELAVLARAARAVIAKATGGSS